jgi:hypothetical protein
MSASIVPTKNRTKDVITQFRYLAPDAIILRQESSKEDGEKDNIGEVDELEDPGDASDLEVVLDTSAVDDWVEPIKIINYRHVGFRTFLFTLIFSI